jgi:hypothetical protein
VTRPRGTIPLWIGVGISVALGAAFTVILAISDHGVHPLVGAVAFGAVYAMPGALALSGRRDRPKLILAAAFVSLGLGVFLISIVTPVMLIPCVCFNIAYARLRGSEPRGRDVLAAIVVVILCAASLALLFARSDTRCWARVRAADGSERIVEIGSAVHGGVITLGGRNEPRGTVESGCTSGVVSTAQGLVALGVLAGAFVFGLAITKPRRDGGSGAPAHLPSVRAPSTR